MSQENESANGTPVIGMELSEEERAEFERWADTKIAALRELISRADTTKLSLSSGHVLTILHERLRRDLVHCWRRETGKPAPDANQENFDLMLLVWALDLLLQQLRPAPDA